MSAHECVARPLVGDKHHAPQTSRWITAVPRPGCRAGEDGGEGGLMRQGANKISHLH